jgi:hypothetical protein
MAVKTTDLPGGGSVHGESIYSQLEYRFTPRHALIGRLEHTDNPVVYPGSRTISIIGYSYRPLYPVSLKIEHQWHNDATANALMASFSVLF